MRLDSPASLEPVRYGAVPKNAHGCFPFSGRSDPFLAGGRRSSQSVMLVRPSLAIYFPPPHTPIDTSFRPAQRLNRHSSHTGDSIATAVALAIEISAF